MSILLIGLIVTAVVVGGIVITSVVAWASRTVRRGANMLHTLEQVAESVETQANMTPRQLQNLTQTYAELIRRDFPEFDAEEFLTAASNTLVLILNALEKGALTDAGRLSDNLKSKVQSTIEDIKSKGEQWFFDDILVHKACIAKYSAGTGTKTIRIEIALQYAYGIMKDGQLTSGSRSVQQYKYTMEAVYIQDVSKLGDLSMKGHNCPNCGAPVRQMGEGKFCEYCGTGLTEINVRIWTFDNYARS